MKYMATLVLLMCLSGCITEQTPYQKLVAYGCWWDCKNEAGETGFCCEKEVPVADHYIFDCKYAGDRVVK